MTAAVEDFSWDEFIPRIRPLLLGRAVKSTGNHADAEQAVQETFTRLVAAFPRFRPDSDMDALAHRTLTRILIDLSRTDRAHGEVVTDMLRFDQLPADTSVEELVLGRLDKARLADRLGRLPAAQAQALTLRASGRTIDEVADLTGVPMRTAQKRLRSGLATLRNEWDVPSRPAPRVGVPRAVIEAVRAHPNVHERMALVMRGIWNVSAVEAAERLHWPVRVVTRRFNAARHSVEQALSRHTGTTASPPASRGGGLIPAPAYAPVRRQP